MCCIVNLDFLTTKQRKIFQVRYKPHGFSPVLSCSFMFSGFLSGHDERFVKGIISDSVNWVIVHGHPINEECLRHVSNACHACQVSIRFLAWRRPKLTFRTYSSYCDRTWTFPTLLPLFEKFLISLKTSILRLSPLRWCCARRLATIRKDDFKRNTALQCWNNIATIRFIVPTMF